MTTAYILGLIIFVGVYYFVCNKITSQEERVFEQEGKRAFEKYEQLSSSKDTLESEMRNLESEALEIFTLYEMTKDIAKGFSEQEAFEIFKTTLHRHAVFKDCKLVHPMSHELRDSKKEKDSFVLKLETKKRILGYVLVHGIEEDGIETVKILGHQFALALRRIKLYQEIEKMAITDSLTDLHTRRHVLERFREELGRSKGRKIKLSFLMIDVDHFKKFNDQYGHLAGDQILREISFIIRENIREIDIAGRFGGEEFCVVLPDTDSEGAIFAAERIRQATEEALIKAYDTQVKATLSIGSATFPDHAKIDSELIDKADWALYRAKKQGRNRSCSFGVYSS